MRRFLYTVAIAVGAGCAAVLVGYALLMLRHDWLQPAAATTPSQSAAGQLTALARPARLIGHRELAAGKTVTVAVAGHDGVPASASAVQVNVIATTGGKASTVSVYPAGATRPADATVYAAAHASAASGALVMLNSHGKLAIHAGAAAESVTLDIEGYTTPLKTVTTLQKQVATLQGQVATLKSTLAGVTATLHGVTRVKDANGYDTLKISGVNVQIVNGSGSEDTLNGVGNLILGYDDNYLSPKPRTGSHNLIVGDYNSWTSYGAIVAGTGDLGAGPYASVLGGEANIATGTSSVIVSGVDNDIPTAGPGAAVLSGWGNTASAPQAATAGGADNTASGWYSSVTGGENNVASGNYAWVGGGANNTVAGSCGGSPAVVIGTGGCG